MAKRARVEAGEIIEKPVANILLDDDFQEPKMNVIPNPMHQEEYQQPEQQTPKEKKLINCLRNEKVIVRFVPRQNALVHRKGHLLDGGMAEDAVVSYVVPLLSTGIFKNVLTNAEKDFLEYAMGLKEGALSVYNKENNFWDDSNPRGIGRVSLRKQDNYFDLSNPQDYIKVKILLANKNEIAGSMQELEDHPKATYRFVIISENAESQSNLSKIDAKKRSWAEYGKIMNDKDTLRVIVETLEGRPTTAKIDLDYLQGRIDIYIDRDARRFLSIIQDELLPAKVLIKKCLEAGLIGKKNDAYYLREDNSPLCEINEESTLNNAAKYISSVKHTALKYSLEAKLKQE